MNDEAKTPLKTVSNALAEATAGSSEATAQDSIPAADEATEAGSEPKRCLFCMQIEKQYRNLIERVAALDARPPSAWARLVLLRELKRYDTSILVPAAMAVPTGEDLQKLLQG